ncbi:hypothetical protein DFH11DRAFT_1541679 [Phellopilus nigrolimitatus]|nr:hypothetical protein DFH11DRAFT_1541679 [Phellopilus nigrolimitatus]
MALSLLRQVSPKFHASLSRDILHFAAVRFNSTSPRMSDDAKWKQVINSEKSSPRKEKTPDESWRSTSEAFMSQSARETPRDAYYGRSVPVNKGDTAGAAKLLDKIMAQNSVARDWMRNKRHTPKGEERRMLKSVRWRKRFKHEVGKKVLLVQEIRRRGA